MQFDKWFNKQSTLIKVILLILPIVGWVTEILVRLSIMLRTKSTNSIIMFLVFALLGELWIPVVIDLVCLLWKGKLFLEE